MFGFLTRAVPSLEYRVQVARCGSRAVELLRAEPPDVVVLDLNVSGPSGKDVYEEIRIRRPDIPVIFVAETKRTEVAIQAMQQGAYEFLFKPVESEVLRRVVGHALDVARQARNSAVAEPEGDAESEGSLVGVSAAMREVYKAVGQVAGQNVPVLVTGESGTGKELVARAIHQHSGRANEPFLALNCAAIPESLLESELFGYEKGAFTGADRRRIGKFEQCDGGTIFLDEVGDMPPGLQAKMLRVLQEQSFERVGGNESVKTNVRLIAATHRDLKAMSDDGRFRPDLFYRLAVFSIHLPPLRARGEDLPDLVQRFVRQFSKGLGRDVREVAPAAFDRLRAYTWPGNVRELQSVLKQALLRASGTVLLESFLPDSFAGRPTRGPDSGRSNLPQMESLVRERLAEGTTTLYEDVHGWVDRIMLPLLMNHTRGNQSRAADCLGIARQTLRHRLRELDLTNTESEVGATENPTARMINPIGDQSEAAEEIANLSATSQPLINGRNRRTDDVEESRPTSAATLSATTQEKTAG
jgi:two-component system nitrogen regulation response regulator GlnG